MDETSKLPLKRVELSLSKFNEVAIPHHLDLLRQHKANIIKYEEKGDYTKVRTEQTHAKRVASQLRSLLGELEALRLQVRTEDWVKFDKLTQQSRDQTLRAIMDYLETSPLSINRRPVEQTVAGSTMSTDSVGIIEQNEELQDEETPLIQLQVNEQEVSLKDRESMLKGWSELQNEVRALHDAWQHVQASALAQREQISKAAGAVETAAVNVEVARSHLSAAERLKAGAMGAGGALVGAAMGGPVGLMVGAKAGAMVAVAGSLLGYLGGKMLGNRQKAQFDEKKDE